MTQAAMHCHQKSPHIEQKLREGKHPACLSSKGSSGTSQSKPIGILRSQAATIEIYDPPPLGLAGRRGTTLFGLDLEEVRHAQH